MTGPKTLAERLEWMAANLPGFREELEAVDLAQRRAIASSPAQTKTPVVSENTDRFQDRAKHFRPMQFCSCCR